MYAVSVCTQCAITDMHCSKYDRKERIVKCSRDITAQSKKLIFTLHRFLTSLDDDEELD